MQVRHLAPGAAQFLVGVVERGDEGVPFGGGVGGLRARHRRAGVGQQLVDGGGDEFGLEFGETGQAGKIEQGVDAHWGIHGKSFTKRTRRTRRNGSNVQRL